MTNAVFSVAGIIVVCYLAGVICKTIKKLNNRFIPAICGTVGGVLGAVLHVLNAVPNTEIIESIGIGIMAGLTATGIKEISKLKEIIKK